MSYINVRDIVISYRIYGKGIPLLLLHGNGEDHTYFHNQIPLLSAEFKVIALDTRGHGFTTRGDKAMNFDVLADDVAYFMKSMNIPKAHILGFSDGGNTAMMLAIKYPHMVFSLILNSANATPQGLKKIVLRQIKLQYFLTKYFLVKQKDRKLELLKLMMIHPQIEKEQLMKINCPVLVLMGENDMILREHGKYLARTIPHASYREIKGGDHFSAMKKPEIFNEIIISYLKGF